MKITERVFGEYDGMQVTEYTLINKHGMKLSALNYGAIVTEIIVPDKEGKFANVSLGFNTIEDYLNDSPYFGAIVGRVAGRIQGASFTLNEKTYQLSANEGENHQHGGGEANFSKRIWHVHPESTTDEACLIFTLYSEAGENGYPGNLDAQVVYTLTNENEWRITYSAKTDVATLYNPTNHVYFNLSGSVQKGVLDHKLWLDSDYYAPINKDLLPNGKLVSVSGTPFDFRKEKRIREAVETDDKQIELAGGGLDQPFLLGKKTPQVILTDYESGRCVEMQTTAPAVVIYTGNKLDGSFQVGGKRCEQYGGVALEAQILPDAIHHKDFGNIVLTPEQPFFSETIYRFK